MNKTTKQTQENTTKHNETHTRTQQNMAGQKHRDDSICRITQHNIITNAIADKSTQYNRTP